MNRLVRENCFRFGRTLTLVIALAMLIMGAASAYAQGVAAGVDCWSTVPGSTANIPELPAGFFGTINGVPSDPTPEQVLQVMGMPLPPGTCDCQEETEVQWLDEHGNPVEPGDVHRVTQVVTPVGPDPYDTCVRRLTDATFPGGDPVSIEIEITELFIKNDASATPYVVDFGDQGSRTYAVSITLDGDQELGILDLILTQAGSGDLILQDLPVAYRIDFQEVGRSGLKGGGSPSITGLSISFQNSGGSFGPLVPVALVEIPTLSGWGLAFFALLLLALAANFIWRRKAAPPP